MQVPGNPDIDVYPPVAQNCCRSLAVRLVGVTERLHVWKYLKEDMILSDLGPLACIYV